MDAWARDQGVEGTMVAFLADTRCELTDALGMRFENPILGNTRCQRFAMVVDKGVIKHVVVSEGSVPDEDSFAEAVLGKC
mmetsp:Transcript_49041/g.149327  ORF Transcript_49041/g.149327 Transcript_49041/m.149327 type:complete len:80 (-) Transcript_49041:117-356(-)